MKKKAMHYRHTAGVGICGIRLADGRVTRNQLKVTCGNCMRRLHGYTEEDIQHLRTERAEHEMTSLMRAEKIRQLEAHAESMKADMRRLEEQLDKALTHADAIQQLAAEGKDPLTGEEPEFWLVWRFNLLGDRVPTNRHYGRESARGEAERLSERYPNDKFYILPAFDYAICEVSPVAWKRKSSEKAPESDEEIPF